MTKSRLHQTADQFRAQILAHNEQAERQLEAWYSQTLVTIQQHLDALYKQIADAQKGGQKIPVSFLYEKNRLAGIQALLKSEMANFSHNAGQLVTQLQWTSAHLGVESGYNQLQATVPVGYTYEFGKPSVKAINELIGTFQQGSPLNDLFAAYGQEASDKVKSALVTGLTLGYNPRRVASSVSQALDIPRWKSVMLCRNSMLGAYRSAALATYRENDDVCDGWIWNADLDRSTCAVCITLNGTLHPLSEEFFGHPNDRCSPSPHTRDWSDILGVDLPDSRPTFQDGSDWFDEQDADTQRAILGNAKYAAYQDNQFSLSDLIQTNHSDDWGKSVSEKSLSDVIGAKQAQQYYEN